MQRWIKILLVAVVVLYAGDYGWLRMRAARDRATAFDSVLVSVVDQIPQKGNKAEYVPEEARLESCVRSLFPHLGDPPCWYLRQHTLQQVNY